MIRLNFMRKPLSFLKKSVVLMFLLSSTTGFCNDSSEVRQACLDIHHQWLDEAYLLTQNCVGFTAPVSGRAYGYIAIGMYESTVEFMPEMISLSEQLTAYKRTVWLDSKKDVNWKLVVNSADYELLKYFFRNMPPSNRERINFVSDSIRQLHDRKTFCGKRKRSIEYGKEIAREIIEWSKLDGADFGFDKNFPESFEPPKCKSCWTKTTPGYLPSLLPYWGTNTSLLSGAQDVAQTCEVFPFSVDSNSFMYNQAMIVLENSKLNDPKYERIAEYWDDGAGYSGTPSGHFFSLVKSIVVKEKIALDDALELYVKLGVAVNEAFISSFELKYKYNFIRPITYIQRYIDPQFNTRIASPPFPEFPSGHSFQSGAASEVMKAILSDTIPFVDSTHVNRSDIDGASRSYASFTEMSEEISISRMYGGIHFQETLDISLDYGRRIGRFVVVNLKCRNE